METLLHFDDDGKDVKHKVRLILIINFCTYFRIQDRGKNISQAQMAYNHPFSIICMTNCHIHWNSIFPKLPVNGQSANTQYFQNFNSMSPISTLMEGQWLYNYVNKYYTTDTSVYPVGSALCWFGPVAVVVIVDWESVSPICDSINLVFKNIQIVMLFV